jgi:two-component system, OmpR family, phosphate regulon sensor histidine kinase PhoR
VKILCFLFGLLVGLSLLGWQQSRFNKRLKGLLRELRSDREGSSLSSASQLAMAIASQQETHHQLEQEVEVCKQVLNHAPIGYLQVDDENCLIWCNSQARQLLGIAQDSYPKPRLLLEVVRSYELDQLIEQTRQAGTQQQLDWTFYPVNPDPSRLSQQQAHPLRGYGMPLPGDHTAIFLENRQETATLMQQRDRWASDVAHELKTPLTSIRLVAETLQMRVNPSLRGWIDRLINETMRLSTLVQDLLDLSQLDQGSLNCLNLKSVDLVELIHAAWLNLEPLASKKHLQLDYSGPDQLLLQLDEPRMYRVLINLLDNSIKYSPPRQAIRVQVSLHPIDLGQNFSKQQVLLEVIDTGPGFLETALPHVFERFYRADPSRSRYIALEESPSLPVRERHNSSTQSGFVANQTDGAAQHAHNHSDPPHRISSGLGLSIVQQIVEAHHGSVMASNHPETGGAWLQVRLPT